MYKTSPASSFQELTNSSQLELPFWYWISLTNLKLSPQWNKWIRQHDDKGSPEIWRIFKNFSFESKLWKGEEDTTDLVVYVLDIDVQFLPEI